MLAGADHIDRADVVHAGRGTFLQHLYESEPGPHPLVAPGWPGPRAGGYRSRRRGWETGMLTIGVPRLHSESRKDRKTGIAQAPDAGRRSGFSTNPQHSNPYNEHHPK